jgi:hypothetical protein
MQAIVILMLPNLLIALVILTVTYFQARLARWWFIVRFRPGCRLQRHAQQSGSYHRHVVLLIGIFFTLALSPPRP